MKLSDTVHIPAPREAVWRGLNDPKTLQAAIPACQSIEKLSETEFKATAGVAIGPVKASFAGTVTLSELDPPRAYRITGKGTGGAAGFASGTAYVRLIPKDAGTDLTYEVEANVGGKLAQIGQRFIDQAAKKLSDEFFERFAAAVVSQQTPAPQPAVDNPIPASALGAGPSRSAASGGEAPPSKQPKLALAIGIAGGVLAVAAALWWLARG